MPKSVKTVLKVVVALVIAVALVAALYIAYMFATYKRIDDNTVLEVRNNSSQVAQLDKEYTALTYNIGFGAYTPDYTFFMDTGRMEDGTETQGKHSWAVSKGSVESCIQGDIDLIKQQKPDLVLLQEVDSPSTRSHNVDELGLIEESLDGMAATNAVVYHSSFLAYPLTEPHGFANSSLATLSSLKVASATRKSYPVADDITKFFDLDRAFSVNRTPVENGKELVVVNSHMSAYDEGGVIRSAQLEVITQFLKEEADKGNYVILGGDFNHALCDSVDMYPSKQQIPDWVATFDDTDLPKGYHVVRAKNLEEVATCRGADVPYEKGVTYETTVDGFIISSNVEASALNIDNGYLYSDHNPVKLTFTLKK